jgi:NADH dehydrogenase FAD-containing subunit
VAYVLSWIAAPIRSVLRKQSNTTVLLGEVVGVDKDRRCVIVNSADRERVPLQYDYLVIPRIPGEVGNHFSGVACASNMAVPNRP